MVEFSYYLPWYCTVYAAMVPGGLFAQYCIYDEVVL